jgi:hypothetical protein
MNDTFRKQMRVGLIVGVFPVFVMLGAFGSSGNTMKGKRY